MDKVKNKSNKIITTSSNSKIIIEDVENKFYNILDTDDSDSESNNEILSNSEVDEYDNLEKELDKKINKNYPKNYGSKWSDKDKLKLEKYLSSSKYQIFYDSDDILINKLANKFGRTVGGIKAEIRRMVFEKYISGQDPESISKNFNIVYRDVKQIIKLHLERESDNEINILEKENKLLKLRIENIKLRDELKNITKQK
jgi:hypothetical protein